ncbi:Uncharacterised protein [Streptococcus pneumoniae]|nr:Uncharacterised protein [Streptococcus pneumoniae]
MKIVEEVNYGFLFYLEGEKMSIKVIYSKFSDVCKYYTFGKKFLDEPAKIIECLDEHFDGVEFGQFDGCNPDNVYVNSFTEVDTKEALIDFAGILDHGEYEQLVNEDRLSAYVEEHEEEIASRLGDSYVFLGHEGDSWFLLQ